MLESKWGLRFIALVLALFLFFTVNDVFKFSDNQLSTNSQTVLEDVPVDAIYDTKNLYLSGAPKTVNIRISGPQSIVKKTESMMDFKVLLNMTKDDIGSHKKKFVVSGLSDKLKYEVMPKFANVTLSEMTKSTHQVQAEISPSRIATGYELIGEEVDPSQVTIVGGEEEIKKIAYVKATLANTEKISENTTEEAEVGVFDANLNKLDVTVQPAKVKVNIKVKAISKNVKIKAKETGKLPNDIKLDSIELSDDEVELFGNRSTLDGIGSISVSVDLSKITKDTTLEEEIPLPKNVTSSKPKKVKIKVNVSKN